MTATTRPLRREDHARWRELWTGYLEFYGSSVPDEVYDTTFERLLDSERPQQCAFVAETGGEVIGLVHVVYHAHNWRVEDVCYIQDLYVDPKVRSTGAGRALIEAVYDAADANGTPSVYWMTQDFNETARKLYDRIATVTPFIKYQR
ncbi:GNAT family N-acetyltransferase [Roseovarius sp. A21]|uniref:GNAT family N-acetyltransferase n=1 Tax=Roseovarius bejariae TaxID=2576383 RepID=A0A844D2S5_9RHOB|nr:GNAT family N-acetyltransferase [Roseovarius bejariae]MRU17090.1 GNAT family N-acetyltransferase [Roseovarius bejariae]